MRKIIVGGIAVATAAALAFAPWASAGGNGAQHSGLSPQAGGSGADSGDQCKIGSGDATNGFVMLNAPGKPGDANKLLGEVSLKNDTAPAGTTYSVNVAMNDGNDACVMEGTLTTNGQGNGNSHIADTSGLTNGSYYVVLQLNGQEKYASGQLSVN